MSEAELIAAAGLALGAEVEGAERIGGGDINDAWRLELVDGRAAFLKSRHAAPPNEFGAEAAGLEWLAEAGGLPTPRVLAVVGADGTQPRGLMLEWVEPGRLDAAGEEELGRGLAITHMTGAESHGCLPPGSPAASFRIGPISLEVQTAGTWADHYAERRLLPLTARARDEGAISEGAAGSLGAICERIGLIAGPPEPPARVHGDLWSGNVLADAGGHPWLIDPSAYGGHREMDLAMLRLFGAPSPRFGAAYEDVFPLADGHAERTGLWQLQPLLVHALLFGGSYGAAVERVARRYCG